MGILSTCALVIPSALAYRARRTRAASIAGMAMGAVLSIAIACAMNLVVTPLYTAVSVADVAAMIIPVLLPFNALKMAINVAAGQVFLAPCLRVVDAGAPQAAARSAR